MTAPHPDANRDPPGQLGQARMHLLEHLAELRMRLIYALVATIIGVALCWIWVDDLFQLMLWPLQQAAPSSELAEMHHRDIAEPFFALLKTSIVGGIGLAFPVIAYQVWAFVAPGLKANERRLAGPFVIASTLFFVLGASFCFFVVLPYGYRFLLEFGAEVSDAQLMIDEYFGMTTKLVVVFGFVFELPVAVSFVAGLGLINYRQLSSYWRAAVIAAFISGALLTPADPMTQLLLAGPLIVLYGLSIVAAWVFGSNSNVSEDA